MISQGEMWLEKYLKDSIYSNKDGLLLASILGLNFEILVVKSIKKLKTPKLDITTSFYYYCYFKAVEACLFP